MNTATLARSGPEIRSMRGRNRRADNRVRRHADRAAISEGLRDYTAAVANTDDGYFMFPSESEVRRTIVPVARLMGRPPVRNPRPRTAWGSYCQAMLWHGHVDSKAVDAVAAATRGLDAHIGYQDGARYVFYDSPASLKKIAERLAESHPRQRRFRCDVTCQLMDLRAVWRNTGLI